MEFSRTHPKSLENLPDFFQIPKQRNMSITFSKDSPELFTEDRLVLVEESSSEDSGTPKFSLPMDFSNLLQMTTGNTSENEVIKNDEFLEGKKDSGCDVDDLFSDTVEATNSSISCQCLVL